jgi:hypothetical protein
MPISVPIFKHERLQVIGTLNEAAKSIHLEFVGAIDEHGHMTKVTKYILSFGDDIKTVEIDLGKVEYLNSTGVRNWVEFLESLEKRRKLDFLHVSEVFLERANDHLEMLGPAGSPVRSVDAPYFCEPCGLRQIRKLNTADLLPAEGQDPVPPPFNCETCGKPLSFDEIPEDYFGYLSRHR